MTDDTPSTEALIARLEARRTSIVVPHPETGAPRTALAPDPDCQAAARLLRRLTGETP